MMKYYFDYDDFGNSLLYHFSGVYLIVVFIVLQWISNRYSDRTIILWGIGLQIATYTWMLIVVPLFQPSTIIS